MKKLFIITLCFVFYTSVFGQCEPCAQCLSSKIDSIAKVNNITNAIVAVNRATNAGQDWTESGEFVIDGSFLVLHDVYYNLNKLLSFSIKEYKKVNCILFVFQDI